MDNIRERLKNANKVTETKKKADKERIAELEQENADLRIQVAEAQDALIELAEIIGGGE